jgi:hypothetical protein
MLMTAQNCSAMDNVCICVYVQENVSRINLHCFISAYAREEDRQHMLSAAHTFAYVCHTAATCVARLFYVGAHGLKCHYCS